MYRRDVELLFPSGVIPKLRDLRGNLWQRLVDRVTPMKPMNPDRLAFILLMVRLCNCIPCQADSFRAMRGCKQCACQAVNRFRGDDQELMAMYEQARDEVELFFQVELSEGG
jgi:hypothetical protein